MRRRKGTILCVALVVMLFTSGLVAREIPGDLLAKLDQVLHPLLQAEREPDQLRELRALANIAGVSCDRECTDPERATVEVLVQVMTPEPLYELPGVTVGSVIGDIATADVEVWALELLAETPEVMFVEASYRAKLLLDKAVPEVGSDRLWCFHNGWYTGDDVIVGVIDSGIDLTHPDFQDAAGKTRILSIWDQTTGSGTPPSSFTYGTEWTSSDIDAGTCSEQDNVAQLWGHGTHVTSIAAGDGSASAGTYSGVAPRADIVFVKLSFAINNLSQMFDETTTKRMVDALKYIGDKASSLGKPVVVNMSLGTHIGPHDDTSNVEKAVNSFVAAGPGRAVVVAAGNEGSDMIHASGNGTATVKLTIPSYSPSSSSQNDIVFLDIWHPSSAAFSITLTSPKGTCTYGPTAAGSMGVFTTSSCGGINVLNATKPGSAGGAKRIAVLLYDASATAPPASGEWTVTMTQTTGSGSSFDMWLTSSIDDTKFTQGGNNSSSVAMPGTASGAIRVGSYITKTSWTDYLGNPRTYISVPSAGNLSTFSSHGPTRDNRQKPDLAAPGQGLVGALSQSVKAAYLANPKISGFVIDDVNNYVLMQGTSMASPMVAGAVAVMLQEDPSQTAAQIKSKLTKWARVDCFTGKLPAGGHPAWGHGKLDAVKPALDVPWLKISCSLAFSIKHPWIFSPSPYPNLFNEQWTIHEPGATAIRVHFPWIDVEEYYDSIIISDGTEVEYGRYDGTKEDVWTVEVPGDSVTITLASDASVTGNGFAIDAYAFTTDP